ncbi:hypothetical protein H6H01_12605 [Nostoc calcicola FACHB-3891]|nr:hypothetical protein [Nostoc calcicola FACHB-3891]
MKFYYNLLISLISPFSRQIFFSDRHWTNSFIMVKLEIVVANRERYLRWATPTPDLPA